MSDTNCVCSSGPKYQENWQMSSLEAKAENGRRVDLHSQQTSLLFHGDAIKEPCQGRISLGMFQDQSAASCRVFLCQVINI